MTELVKTTRRRRAGALGAAALGLAVGLPQLNGGSAAATSVPPGVTEKCQGNPNNPDGAGWTRFTRSGAADIMATVCYFGNQGNLQISRVIVANRNSNGHTDYVFVNNIKAGTSTQRSLPTASIQNQWYFTDVTPPEPVPSGYNSTTISIWDQIDGGNTYQQPQINVKLM